jgi:mono/diheme cytochrome c family protein
MKRLLGLMLVAAWAVGGCSKSPDNAPPLPKAAAPAASDEVVSFSVLNRGQQLYQEHCAQCHGPEGQGHPDWETPGVGAAPPLNGSGTDVKRSRAQLVAAIKDGVARDGSLTMPAWKGRLNDADVDAVITWFQTVLWSPDIYAHWRRNTAAIPPG